MPIRRQDTMETLCTPAPITLMGANKGTLAAVFGRPSRHDLDCRLVIDLMETIGTVEESGPEEWLFEVVGMAHLMPKPVANCLDPAMVAGLRRFLTLAGWTPQTPPTPAAAPAGADQGAGLMIVVDKQGARLFHVDLSHSDQADHEISIGDPRIFLQHLSYAEQPRTLRQRTASDNEFNGKITAAVSARCTIFVVSDGNCFGQAADSLIAFLRLHHPGTYKRVVCAAEIDLSAASAPALLLLLPKHSR